MGGPGTRRRTWGLGPCRRDRVLSGCLGRVLPARIYAVWRERRCSCTSWPTFLLLPISRTAAHHRCIRTSAETALLAFSSNLHIQGLESFGSHLPATVFRARDCFSSQSCFGC